jgi:hypothetical protein
MNYWLSWIVTMGMACLTAGLSAQPFEGKSEDYHRADSIAAAYADYPLADVRDLSLKLTKPFTRERDKYRAIFRWVCDNIRSDYKLYCKVKQIRKRYQSNPASLAISSQKINKQVFTHLREKRSTICTGYAYLLNSLAQHAGLACRIVDGYARTAITNLEGSGYPNHSWNAIRIDNQWYLSDPTWASGSIYEPMGIFIPRFNESYFLVPPPLFVHSHFPLDTAQLLLREKPTLSDFLSAPLAYAASYEYALSMVTPRQFFLTITKEQSLSITVKQECGKPFQKLSLKVNESEVVVRQVDPTNSVESVYTLTHTFLTRGYAALHILVDGKPAYSYSVKVK